MLQLNDISKSYGPRHVLRGAACVVNAGEVLGVIGPNGGGKSTLLRIAAGNLPPDSGSVAMPPGTGVAHLRQAVDAPPGATVGERFPTLFPGATTAALEAISRRIASGDSAPALLERYGALVSAVGRGEEGRSTQRALGIDSVDATAMLDRLSGGEQAKLAPAEVMTSPAGILLLDEPTNHLDLAGIRWLEERLAAYEGAVLIVSHDRALLDEVADGLLVLGTSGEPPEVFTGSYSEWIEERERRRAEQWSAFGGSSVMSAG